MNKDIKPLYRKVNTCTHNVHHSFGGDARHDRNTKGGLKRSMKKDVHRGLDYTPLYRFLLSKVGQDWDAVYSEAISRLDRKDPIFDMVALNETDKKDYFRSGESSYHSGLFVNENNILQLVNPNLKNEDLIPSCNCCTHTFNGKPLNKKWINPYNTEKNVKNN